MSDPARRTLSRDRDSCGFSDFFARREDLAREAHDDCLQVLSLTIPPHRGARGKTHRSDTRPALCVRRPSTMVTSSEARRRLRVSVDARSSAMTLSVRLNEPNRCRPRRTGGTLCRVVDRASGESPWGVTSLTRCDDLLPSRRRRRTRLCFRRIAQMGEHRRRAAEGEGSSPSSPNAAVLKVRDRSPPPDRCRYREPWSI